MDYNIKMVLCFVVTEYEFITWFEFCIVKLEIRAEIASLLSQFGSALIHCQQIERSSCKCHLESFKFMFQNGAFLLHFCLLLLDAAVFYLEIKINSEFPVGSQREHANKDVMAFCLDDGIQDLVVTGLPLGAGSEDLRRRAFLPLLG